MKKKNNNNNKRNKDFFVMTHSNIRGTEVSERLIFLTNYSCPRMNKIELRIVYIYVILLK